MSRTSTARDRRPLEKQLQSHPYAELLTQVQSAIPALRQSRSWGEVATVFNAKATSSTLRDSLLRAIFRSARSDNDPRWSSILLLLFWRTLEAIFRRKIVWDHDREELWANVTWAFLRVIHSADIHHRPERLAQKIMNDTQHRLHDEYRRKWDIESRYIRPPGGEDESPEEPVDPDWPRVQEDMDWRCDRARRERFYASMVEQGLLSELDRLLLIGRCVYGWTVAICAEKAGLETEAAKKRLQRAQSKIRGLDPLNPRRNLSPSPAPDPPLPGEDR